MISYVIQNDQIKFSARNWLIKRKGPADIAGLLKKCECAKNLTPNIVKEMFALYKFWMTAWHFFFQFFPSMWKLDDVYNMNCACL